jgi:hypothetical protein
MAIKQDLVVKNNLLVTSNVTVPTSGNLVTTNEVRTIANPTIDINFTKTNQLDSRILFTRSSAGTYVNSAGIIAYAGVNQPRFDYDPITGQSKGLLIEEQITNLLTYSTSIGSGSWNTRAGTTSVTSSGIAPDGSNNATLVTNTTGDGYVWEYFTFTPSTSYVFSFYAKAASGSPTIAYQAWTGLVGYSASPGALGSNYTRYSLAFTTTATVTSGDIGLYVKSGSAYVWGAQLETTTVNGNNTQPTSIIPTVASQVTRSVDIATFNPDPKVFNPYLNTFFIDFDANNTGYSFPLNSESFAEIATARGNTDVGTWNGFYSVDAINNSVNINNGVKYAIAYNQSQVQNVLSGGAITTSPYPPLYRPSNGYNFHLGGYSSNYRTIDGHIRRFTYWPQVLSGSQLQLLTRSN